MHATCCTVCWWLYVVVYMQCFTTGITLSIPSLLVVIRSLCVFNYVSVIVVFALLCLCMHSVHYTGADTESKDSIGLTPLMYVCINGHREVAAALLDHGELLCQFSVWHAVFTLKYIHYLEYPLY